ncbi:MAG: GHKL domain-containing protein [Clostridia bacterium]|nr:GHKL domain-containing protein [Clostridia bacterium]
MPWTLDNAYSVALLLILPAACMTPFWFCETPNRKRFHALALAYAVLFLLCGIASVGMVHIELYTNGEIDFAGSNLTSKAFCTALCALTLMAAQITLLGVVTGKQFREFAFEYCLAQAVMALSAAAVWLCSGWIGEPLLELAEQAPHALRCAQLALSSALAFALCKLMYKRTVERVARVPRFQWASNCVFFAALFAAATFAVYKRAHSHISPAALMAVPLYGVALLGIIRGVFDWRYIHRLRIEIEHTRLVREYVAAMRERQREFAEIKHDTRNHLLAMSVLLDEGDVSGLRAYLNELNAQYSPGGERICDNALVSALLESKLNPLRSAGAEVCFKASLPPDSALSDFDLVTILSNLLDNAAHAVSAMANSADGQVDVVCVEDAMSFKLSVSNTFTAANTRDPDDFNHGHGQAIVRRSVKRLGGICSFKAEDGVYRAAVYIPLCDAPPPPEQKYDAPPEKLDGAAGVNE